MGYEDVSAHQAMLEDEIRTGAYKEAIERVVGPHTRVLDFGCGSGILSFFAARKGVRSVWAVDRSSFIRIARELARENGIDNVRFFHSDGETVELPGKVDVIVSEWMWHFVISDWMMEPLIRLRDEYLEDGGAMIPSSVTMKAGLVTDPDSVRRMAYFEQPRFGVDFSMLKDWPYHRVATRTFSGEQVHWEVSNLLTLDMNRCASVPTLIRGDLAVGEGLRVYGLCGWFDTELVDGVGFGTGPFDSPTHWKQLFFPFRHPVDLPGGSEVKLEFRPSRQPGSGETLWAWSLTHPGGKIEMDDFVHRAWLMRDLPAGELP